MTSLLDAAPANVMEVLRGERDGRPRVNTTAAAGLRAQLEDGIFELLGPALRATPCTIRAASLRRVADTLEGAGSPAAQVRGLLVNQALRLMGAGAAAEAAFDEALAAWRADDGANDLTAFVDGLDADERARLASDVTAHCLTLARSLGALPSRWQPRTALRAYQRLAGGNVILRDVVDLMVGTTLGDEASVALLDVTTAPLGEGAERVMRYHALVQTLRTSTVPLRTSIFSSATGELWCADVDDELLERAVADVLEVLGSMGTAP
jgi:hypothetical protein